MGLVDCDKHVKMLSFPMHKRFLGSVPHTVEDSLGYFLFPKHCYSASELYSKMLYRVIISWSLKDILRRLR